MSALLFLLFYLAGILAAFFNSAAAAFVVYQLVYFVNPGIRWWYNDIPAIPYSFIAVLVMMFFLVKNYRKLSDISPWLDQAPFKWMVLLLALYYVTAIYALAPQAHLTYTNNLTKLFLIVFVAYKLIYSETAFNASIWAYLTGCTYLGYVATITGRNSGDRVEGIGMVDGFNSNDTAAALVPAAVILMLFAWQGNFKTRVVSVFMGALIANGLILINSRGSFLGVLVSLGLFLLFMFFSKYQKKGQRLSAIFIVIFGISGAIYMTDSLFWDRMSTLQNTEDEKSSGSSRIVFWMVTFDMLEDHPLGMGIKGYNLLAPIYMDDETRGGVTYRSVHSSWFQGLSEIGWVGLMIFLAMLFSLAKLSSKAKLYVKENHNFKIYFKIVALECSFLGYLVTCSFINRFRSEILYWMILFLLLAVKIYYLNPKKASIDSN